VPRTALTKSIDANCALPEARVVRFASLGAPGLIVTSIPALANKPFATPTHG
jgi:hypothetical protein